MGKIRKKPILLFVIALVTLYVIIYIVPGVTGALISSYTAVYGQLRVTDETTGYLVRNETVYTASAGGEINRYMEEGDLVRQGASIMEINGKLYKEYRGMGSMEAMRHGSAARYGHDLRNSKITKVAPEGVEALKEVSGSVDQILITLAGGVQSGLGYLGAPDLKTLRERARFIRVSAAGQRESAPHDIVEIKTAPGSTRG